MTEPTPHRAQREIEDMRLQLAVDRLMVSGVLQPELALRSPGGFERMLAERGVLGLDLEAVKRQARQMRCQARTQLQIALTQRDAAAAQWERVISLLAPADRSAAPSPRAGSARRA